MENVIGEVGQAVALLTNGQLGQAEQLLKELYIQLVEEHQANERAFEEWVAAREAEALEASVSAWPESWEVARELNSSTEILEEVPF